MTRPLRLAVALTFMAGVLAGCAGAPKTSEANPGVGWAPFPIVAYGPMGNGATTTFSPTRLGTNSLRICVVLPTTASEPLVVAEETAAIVYGIANQAERENATIAYFRGATNAEQASEISKCRADRSSKGAIVQWVDTSRAGLAHLIPTNAHDWFPYEVVGAPTGSFAATLPHNVAEPRSQAATMAAQWALGYEGGTAGTVAVLPGPNLDAAGHPTQGHVSAGLVQAGLAGTALKVVGVYYGPDTPARQRALALKAITQHPGLSLLIGTPTAAAEAGKIVASMNTDRHVAVVSLGIDSAVNAMVTSGAIAAAMSGSPVVQGRIALSAMLGFIDQEDLLIDTLSQLAPVPVPIDATNVDSSPTSWWQAPSVGSVTAP